MKQNIIIHKALSNYMWETNNAGQKKGESKFSLYLKKWLKEHKKAKKYFGDLRSEKKKFKSVHKFYAFEPNPKYKNNMYRELNSTYIIE